jgi:hypothetical protein
MSEALETEIRVLGFEETIRTLQDYMKTIRETGVVTKEMAEDAREMMRSYREVRRTISHMRTVWKAHHATLLEGIRAFRQFGYIGRELVRMWQAYSVAMLRIERAQRDVEDAARDVAYYQQLYNQYLRDFGKESIFTQQSWENLQRAIESEKEALAIAQKTHEDMRAGWVLMGLDAVTFAGNLAHVAEAAFVLKASLNAVSISLASLASAIPPVAVGLGLLAGAWYLSTKPIEVQNKGLADLSNALSDFEEHGKWVIKNLAEQKEAFESTKQNIDDYKGVIDSLFKRSPLPELNIWLQETTKSLNELTRGFEIGRKAVEHYGRAIPSIRHVQINQYIGNVSSEIDITRMGDEAYRKLMRRLEQIW